jgi:formylglycine-generating enzyme required for sulfatase activity
MGVGMWEYAAGGPNRYPWALGNEFKVSDYCSDMNSNKERSSTCPVKSFPANGFGLYDMGGNVGSGLIVFTAFTALAGVF